MAAFGGPQADGSDFFEGNMIKCVQTHGNLRYDVGSRRSKRPAAWWVALPGLSRSKARRAANSGAFFGLSYQKSIAYKITMPASPGDTV